MCNTLGMTQTAQRETYRGVKLVIRKGRQWGYIAGEINGHGVLDWVGRMDRPADVERARQSLRGTVDHFNESPANYTNGDGDVAYGMKVAA